MDRDLLEDLRIEVRQAIEMVGIADDIRSQMMDAFASIVSNNLNAVMKVLTSVTILVAVPSLLACIAIAAALFVYFRRRKWL